MSAKEIHLARHRLCWINFTAETAPRRSATNLPSDLRQAEATIASVHGRLLHTAAATLFSLVYSDRTLSSIYMDHFCWSRNWSISHNQFWRQFSHAFYAEYWGSLRDLKGMWHVAVSQCLRTWKLEWESRSWFCAKASTVECVYEQSCSLQFRPLTDGWTQD